MEETLSISGTVETVVYANEQTGYAVLEVADERDGELYTAVGPLCEVRAGEEVTLHGRFAMHPTFGQQFKTESYEVRLPETAAAIRRYLSGGALPHIGKAIAARIVAAFGEESLEVIASQPEVLATVKGLTREKAYEASREFQKMFGVREAIECLARWQLPASVAVALYRHYGPDTVDMLRHDPYLLCGYPAYQDFRAADAIAGQLGLEYDSFERVRAGLVHVLRHNLNNGHACLPAAKLVPTVAQFLHVEPQQVESALRQMCDDGDAVLFGEEEDAAVYLPEYYDAERCVALALRETMCLPPHGGKSAAAAIRRLEAVNGIRYAPLQKQAIEKALSENALVLTGGPGTGKTTAVNGMLAAFEENGDRVALAAPTGRAAKRLSELTGRKAKTIHRLLEVDHTAADSTRFLHNAKNPLKCDVIVIDEMSMVDVLLFQSLLNALKPNCRIIMVGDEDQLPSVGAGNVLASVIASGLVPVVRLKEIFRQAAQSLIISNAHHIVEGLAPQKGTRDSDFFQLECPTAEACAALVCDLVARRLPQSYGYDPMEDIQVLCPTKMGPVGTQALCAALQQRLNPPAAHKAELKLYDKVLRTGDKVMQVRNDYDIPFTRPGGGEDGAGAFNGDMGIIEAVDPREGTVTVRSEDRRLVYSGEALRELELAYAITIHKSQGSEFAAVVIPLFEVPPRLCYRNLLYTGVTRAKDLCILAGHAAEAAAMAQNAMRNKRFSKLAQMLKGEGI